MAIGKKEIDLLLQRETKPDSHVLSVYLDVDQSHTANLNRGYVSALRDMLRSCQQTIPESERDSFAKNAERVIRFVSGQEPRGRAFIIFCDDANGFFWNCDLRIPVKNEIRWNNALHVKPLMEALDEYERYCVVVASKEEGRIYSIFLGEIEQTRAVEAADRSKHYKSVPKDRSLSTQQIQNREDELASRHLKEVAAAVEKFAAENPFGRLVLGGQTPITKELERQFSKKLQGLVVASTTALTVASTPQEILAETRKLEESVERSKEVASVDNLITLASKGGQAVVQLQPTLNALREGRIRTLVYADGLKQNGSACRNCGTFFSGDPGSCTYCGTKVAAVDDLIAEIVQRVVDSGGGSENVRGQAADRMRSVGGIGAFLRF